MNEFKIGDTVKYINHSASDLTIGRRYTILGLSKYEPSIKLINDSGHICFSHSGCFKHTRPKFQPEYFSALNEKDAEKYIRKTMEFADSDHIRNNLWKKAIFTGSTKYATKYPFASDNNDQNYQFCRTCPETFQKKKIFERWINVYKDTDTFYNTREEADANAAEPRIDCIHIYKEYEVEE
jgi:hypothetical protein